MRIQGDSVHLVELAALLHDVQDWKYSHSEDASRASVQARFKAEIYTHVMGLEERQILLCHLSFL